MLYPVAQNLCGTLQRENNWKCFILTALILSCMGAVIWCRFTHVTKVVINFSIYPIKSTRPMSPCDEGYIYIPLAFMAMLYLVYLVECWHCTARIELGYRVGVDTVLQRVQQMRESQPIVWWKAVCYHYVRRKRQVTRYRNGDAYTSTQVYYERVNSHAAAASFVFSYCGVRDISKRLVFDPRSNSITKIRFSKDQYAEEKKKAKDAGMSLQEYRDSQKMKAAGRTLKKFKRGKSHLFRMKPTALIKLLKCSRLVIHAHQDLKDKVTTPSLGKIDVPFPQSFLDAIKTAACNALMNEMIAREGHVYRPRSYYLKQTRIRRREQAKCEALEKQTVKCPQSEVDLYLRFQNLLGEPSQSPPCPICYCLDDPCFAFANVEAAAEFEEQRARFFAEQERYDDYMEMREGLDLTNFQGFREHVIALADPDRIPWYAGQTIFWLCSFLLLSWPLRLVLEYNTAYLHYKVTKLFGVNYEAGSAIASTPSANLSVNASTPDVTEIEWGIKENTALVPSYSEALLMDVANHPSTNQDDQRRSSEGTSGGVNRSSGPLFFSTPLAYTSPPDPYREPPPYEEALSLPGLTRLRRSLTDRGDICGRFLASRRRSANIIRAPGRTRTLITMETSL